VVEASWNVEGANFNAISFIRGQINALSTNVFTRIDTVTAVGGNVQWEGGVSTVELFTKFTDFKSNIYLLLEIPGQNMIPGKRITLKISSDYTQRINLPSATNVLTFTD